MRFIKPLTIIGGLLLPLSGCVTDSTAASAVGFEVLSSEIAPENGVLENRKIEFMSDQYAFDVAFSRYSVDPALQIDFTRNQVVLINAGNSSDAVTGIDLNGVEEQNGTLVVYATELIAGEGCIVPALVSSPYIFVKISSAARVRLVQIDREVVNCNAS